MSLPKLTGNLFRAGRALAGLTRDDLANRAGLSRDVRRSWEVSSDRVVPARYQMLCPAIAALEAAGIVFSMDGVSHQRTVLLSDNRAASAGHQSGAAMSYFRKMIAAVGDLDFIGEPVDEFAHGPLRRQRWRGCLNGKRETKRS